jgi:hypothetical protein
MIMEVPDLIRAPADYFSIKSMKPQAPLFKLPAQPASVMRTDKLKHRRASSSVKIYQAAFSISQPGKASTAGWHLRDLDPIKDTPLKSKPR